MEGIDVVSYFHGFGLVTYRMTNQEITDYIEALRETIDRGRGLSIGILRSLFGNGNSVASNMSPELESLLCGGEDKRYELILSEERALNLCPRQLEEVAKEHFKDKPFLYT